MIAIKIGDYEKKYRLFSTNAPEKYDMGSSITVGRDDDKRYVLVEECSADWHLNRWASGMYRGDAIEDAGVEEWSVQEAWKRLLRRDLI